MAEQTVDNGSDETVQWTLTDHLNTVRDIAQYDPDDEMTTVVNHLIYDAFGRVTSESNPAADSLFLFTARPFDSDNSLQNNLNRWYDPAVGRWLSEDPIGFAAADGNLYRYVGNQVLVATDPIGLADVCDRNLRLCMEGAANAQAWCHARGMVACAILCNTLSKPLGPEAYRNCYIACQIVYQQACVRDASTFRSKCHKAYDTCKETGCWPGGIRFWGIDWGKCEVCW